MLATRLCCMLCHLLRSGVVLSTVEACAAVWLKKVPCKECQELPTYCTKKRLKDKWIGSDEREKKKKHHQSDLPNQSLLLPDLGQNVYKLVGT